MVDFGKNGPEILKEDGNTGEDLEKGDLIKNKDGSIDEIMADEAKDAELDDRDPPDLDDKEDKDG